MNSEPKIPWTNLWLFLVVSTSSLFIYWLIVYYMEELGPEIIEIKRKFK